MDRAPELRVCEGLAWDQTCGLLKLQRLFRKHAFWAESRSKGQLKSSIIVVSLWRGKRMVGFRRDISDGIHRAVLTDGDFRRWIATCGEIDLNRPLTAAMNPNLRSATEGASTSDLSALLKTYIIALPQLDSRGRVAQCNR